MDITQPSSIYDDRQAWWAQAAGALVSGVAMFAIGLILVILAYEVRYSGRIYPGVSVSGINLSGLQPEEAAALLVRELHYTEQGTILVQDGDNLWAVQPSELGLFLDPEATAQTAYRIGRSGGMMTRLGDQFRVWRQRVETPPLFIYDERIAQNYLNRLAEEVNRSTVEADLGVDGVEIMVHSGQIGRTVDVPATLALIGPQIQSMLDGVVTLVVHETPPIILDANEQAEIARTILSAPLTLTIPNPTGEESGPWTFDPQTLAEMLSIERVEIDGEARYQVGLNLVKMTGFLEGIAESLDIQPENARFIFNDDTRQLDLLAHATTGRSLDIEASIQDINQRLAQNEHEIALTFDYTLPEASSEATAEELGITEAVSVQSSYFYGSSSARIQNILTASARFHGLLVAPGETFSMVEALGDISLDTGYAEALIIYGDRTIKGVGGGVCQVSTTLFRAVFFGGFPVNERNSHAYRVSYYEYTASGSRDLNLVGLDATVYAPLVDFKFTNDTPYWLLMETYVNVSARRLTWKFYSTSDGRTVEWHSTGLTNTVEPPDPLYEEDPELEKGDIEQVDWEAQGADVTITRTVRRDGQVYFTDTFTTHYLPWRAIYHYGPGTKGMPPPEDD